MTTISIIILIIVLGVLFYVFNTQRELVRLDELCKNAFSQIAVQLNSRWDAVLALAKMAAQYSKHESETIIKTIQARRMDGQVKTAAEANEQQGAFAQVLGRLIAVGEAYPELKANEQYSKTMDGINDYEEKVRQSRMVYNDTATKMNRMVRQWPSSIVASMLHFSEREYLTVDEEKKSAYPNLDDVFKTNNEQA
ncbi:MAG: LemA family protein [Prevotella sp.]|jgi:LemA protein|nr:LemA family protein [Prevotella sp.]MBQ1645858.1 LemA family protein [Prevotella sp.]MBQ1760287.1 LemA family protein [Prevotella sp.]MBQ1799581.1 LemA family protein [Prevotella sp.]MBQ2361813.1 LemA family protein [Prevotella sp.]